MLRVGPPDISAFCFATEKKDVTNIRCYTNGFAKWLLHITGHVVDLRSQSVSYCLNRSSLARFITEKFQHPDVDNKQFRHTVLSLINRAIEKGEVKADTDLSSFIELILSRANVPIDKQKKEALVKELEKENEAPFLPIKNFISHALEELKTPTAEKMMRYKQALQPLQTARESLKEVIKNKEALLQRADHLVVRGEKLSCNTEKLVQAKNQLEKLFSSPPSLLVSAEIATFVADVQAAVKSLEEEEKSVALACFKKELEGVRSDIELLVKEIEAKAPHLQALLQHRDLLAKNVDTLAPKDLDAFHAALSNLQSLKKEVAIEEKKSECRNLVERLKEQHLNTSSVLHLQKLLDEKPTPHEFEAWLQKASVALEKGLQELSLVARLAKTAQPQEEVGPVFAQELKKKAQENKVKKIIGEMKVSFLKVVGEKSEEMQTIRLGEVAGDLSRCVASFCDAVKEQPAICEGCLKELLEVLATTIETQKGNLSRVALRKAFPVVASLSTGFIAQFTGTEGQLLREVFLDVLKKMPTQTTGAVREFAKTMHEKMQLSQSVLDLKRDDLVEQIAMWCELCLNHPSQTQAALERLIQSIKAAPNQEEVVAKLCSLITLKCQMAKEGENFLDDVKSYLFLAKRDFFSTEPSFKKVCALLQEGLGLQEKPHGTLDMNSEHLSFLFNAAPEESQAQCREHDVALTQVAEHALELALQKLESSTATHPIYIGTEWAFMADSPEKMYRTLDRLSSISRKYPHVTFMPGSIAWCQKIHSGAYACFNTLPVFENGRLVSLYHKRYEKMDLDTVAGVFKKKRKNLAWALSDPATKKLLQDFNSNFLVSGKGHVLAFEICNDHINLAAQEDYKQRAPTGSGADVHVLMAHGSILNNVRASAHNGSLVAYIDHSTSAQTSVATLQKAKESQEWINKEKRANVNQNFGLVGAFKAHCYKAEKPLEPTFLEHPPGEKSIDAFFKILSGQVGLSPEVLKAKVIDHLQTHALRYCPEGDLPLVKKWTAASFADFQKTLLQRYTFHSPDDLQQTIQVLKSGKGESLNQLVPILLNITSELLSRQIVLKSDLANLPTQIHDPERKKPYTQARDALQVGYSYKDGMFYSVG